MRPFRALRNSEAPLVVQIPTAFIGAEPDSTPQATPGWLFAPTGVACGVESGAGTSGLRAPGAPIPLHRRLHSTNFSREVATPILHSAEAQNGPSFDLDAALGPTSTQPYTAAGCRSRTGMTVTVTRHDDRLSRQIRGTRHDVSSYTGGMATAVPI